MRENSKNGIVIDRSILEKLNQIAKSYMPSSEGEFFAVEFLERAQDNLRDSKLLFCNKSYANSIFLFQQSVEKAMKSLLYATNTLKSEEDAYSKRIGIGHDSVAAFERFIDKIRPAGEEMAKFGMIENADINGKVISTVAEEYGGADVDSSTLAVLCTVLHFLNYLIHGYEPETIKETTLRILQKPSVVETIPDGKMYSDFLNELGVDYATPSIRKEVEKVIDSMLAIASQAREWIRSRSAVTMMSLLILAMITNPHESTTRYPTLVSGRLSPEEYDLNLGIVQNMPSLFALHQMSVDFLSDYLHDLGILSQRSRD